MGVSALAGLNLCKCSIKVALTYHDLVSDIALRISALIGVDSAALNTTFLIRPLTQANFQSAVFPFEPVKDALQMAEGKLCQAIANTGNHPWRDYISSTTGNLANKASLPSLDANSKQIIGIWGSVYDASDGKPCKENQLENIQRIVDNSGSRYLMSHYFYRLDGQRIYHTRTNVKIDCCFYDGDAQKTAIDADGSVLLPYALEEAYVCGTVALLMRDDEFAGLASRYAAYFADALQSITQGLTSVSSKVIPAPTLNAEAA